MKSNKNSVAYLATGGVVAALYVALTLAVAPVAFYTLQFRASEVLTLLPLFTSAAVPGLTVGCVIANFAGAAMGLNSYVDVAVGSLATLIAGFVTLRLRNVRVKGLPVLSFLSPVVFNMFIVGPELALLYDLPPVLTVLQVGVSELIVVAVLGVPLFLALEKSAFFEKRNLDFAAKKPPESGSKKD